MKVLLMSHIARIGLASILLTLMTPGCSNKQSDNTTALRQKHSQAQLTVACVPIIDSTKTELEWNLSEELSSAIYDHLAQSDKLALVNPNKIRAATKKLKEAQNPFNSDVNWIKNTFAGNDFAVFLELIEHEEVLRENQKTDNPESCSADLNMSMRIRVFDLRDNEPKVVLQELLHDSHFIPRPFTHVNFHQTSWGDPWFSISPLGLAHAQFAKEISSRLEDYILLSSK
jgi:hypothetical protein